MPAIINSAPDCVTHVEGAKPADDSADFIIQANYEDCAGIMTFGPGSTYGEGGAAAAGAYKVLIALGAVVMILAFIAWIIFENRRLIAYATKNALGIGETQPPQPGNTAP
jgi:hypothetical protein